MIHPLILSLTPIPLPSSIPLQIRKLYKYSNEIQSLDLLNKELKKRSMSQKLKQSNPHKNKVGEYGHLLP
jgi:hypothetical protein